jgi:hypothetical protein
MAYTTIDKSDDYFNTVLWTGTGSNGHAITGVGFQPDLVWVKNRSEAYDHVWFDSVRGVLKHIESNNDSAEENEANTLTAFGSDGFTVGTDTLNKSGNNIVSWNWLASNTTASNTDGSITSTVSANTTSGFSIVSYTGNGSAGATVGHGLGSTPKMIIVKRRNTAAQWNVYHESLGNTGALYLNDTIAFNVVAGFWNDTSPNSTTFTLGTDAAGNGSGDTYIAYCFADVKGFSKFGSYTGNGNADGTFVYTGFKPAYLMIKQSSAAGEGWHILDNKRSGANGDMERLLANSANAESNYSGLLDLVSNGFKTRTSDAGVNASSATYIYMAFAENPFVTSTSVPTTAR